MKSTFLSLNDAPIFYGCVLAYGHFNTIHPGHIRYLRHARNLGEKLVVALIGDGNPEEQSIYPFLQKERAEALSLLGIADKIYLLQSEELIEAVELLKPSFLILGTEFQQRLSVEDKLALKKDKNCIVQFHAGDAQYASTDLLSFSERELRLQRREKFNSACIRQGLDQKKILSSMENWRFTRLAVLGDTILDQYAACEALGMSAEAPVVVVRELEKKNFIGGAAVVAAHIRALGAACDLVSVVGADNSANHLKKELKTQGIGDALIIDSSRPTTFKKRYIVENQKLFRVSRLEDNNLNKDVEEKVIAKLESLAPSIQGIIVSDFVYGVITPNILKVVESLVNRYKLFLFGDVQCSSQVGSVTRFKNFSLLCPNEREARLALQDKESGLELLSQKLLKHTKCERLIMKLGAEGFIAYDKDSAGNSQAFPALSVNPVDVAGAGDSLLAVMATGLASKQGIMPTAALACCMASLAVETMGNSPISSSKLRSSIMEVLYQ